jgi:valyl-tRNA synthetase
LPADRALLSRLQALIAAVTARWEAYDYAGALDLTERFFWSAFCDDYLELVKGRLYDGTPAEQATAHAVARSTLLTLVKLFAPVLPHVTEAIFQQMGAAPGESIHFAHYRAGSAPAGGAGGLRRRSVQCDAGAPPGVRRHSRSGESGAPARIVADIMRVKPLTKTCFKG